MPAGWWVLPRAGEPWPWPEEEQCGCLCGAAHPHQAGVCDVAPVVTSRRYRAGLFRAVRVPLCAGCAHAQGR